MALLVQTNQLLEKAAAILPHSGDDLIYKGVAAGLSERIFELKRARNRLEGLYGSLDALGNRIQAEGVSPDDHTLYNDLLEWRAINHELTDLLQLFETL